MDIKLGEKNSVTLPSDISLMDDLRALFIDFIASHEIPPEDQMTWQLVFTELVANAIIHGAKSSPESEIVVKWWKDSDEVVMTIDDPGSGPTPLQAEFPALPEDPLAESGRGLFINSQFVSRWDRSRTLKGYHQLVSKRHLGI